MQQADCAHSAPGTCASSGKINETSVTTRRGLIGLVAAAGAIGVAVPAVTARVIAVTANTPFQKALAIHEAAETRFNELPADLELRDAATHSIEEERLSAAWQQAITTEPASWADFTQQLDLISADGMFGVDEDNLLHLLRQARRLLRVKP